MTPGAVATAPGPVVDEFLERLRVEDGSSALTITAYRRDLARLVGFLRTRRRTLETARPDDLVAHLETLRRAGRSPRTLARGLAAIRGLYRFGRSAGLLRNDPAALLETPRLPRRLPRALSKVDAAALVESPADEGPRAWRDRALLELLYGSGLRASELVGLRPADVDLYGADAPLPGQAGSPATGADRRRGPPRPRHVHGPGAPATGASHGPGRALRERAGWRPPSAGALADRARSRRKGRRAGGIPPCAPPFVREPPSRGRRRPPVRPGAAGTRRHRDHGDLHAPPDGRRSPTVPPVSPAGLSMMAGGRRGRRQRGMSGSAAVTVRRTSYPQVDPRAAGLMAPALVVVPPGLAVREAAQLARRRRARLVVARVGRRAGRARHERRSSAPSTLGLGAAPLDTILWDTTLVAPGTPEVLVRRQLGPDRPFVLVGGARGPVGVVFREPEAPGGLPLSLASRLDRLARPVQEALRTAARSATPSGSASPPWRAWSAICSWIARTSGRISISSSRGAPPRWRTGSRVPCRGGRWSTPPSSR